MALLKNQLLTFLRRVDKSFPTPLSEKCDLEIFADKLLEKADIFYEIDEEEIVSLIAGYTENVVDNLAYVSILATLESHRGRGLGKQCLEKFILLAEEKGMSAVHLYTDRENKAAVAMYLGAGFVPFIVENESRPDDLHLILDFQEDK